MTHFKKIAFLFSLVFTLSEARVTDGKIKLTLQDKVLVLKSEPGFHLNEKAPAKLIFADSKKTVAPSKKEKLEFRFPIDVTPHEIALEYYVCDDANTTCEQHRENYSTLNNQLTKLNKSVATTQTSAESTTTGPVFNKHHFIVDNLESAKSIAQKSHKLLLVDFSAPWCPACLRLETEVFGEKKFQALAQKIVSVSLNIDNPVNIEAHDLYKVTVIPTLIVMNSEGEEIDRIVDFRPTDELISILTQSLKKDHNVDGYNKLLLRANIGDKLAMRALALRAYNMYDLEEADSWFKKIEEKSLFSASTDIQIQEKNKTSTLIDSYKLYIAQYPESFDSLNWRLELIKELSPLAKNCTFCKTLSEDNITLINKALTNRKFQKKLFKETAQGIFSPFEEIELVSKLVETYQLLGEKTLSENAIKDLKKLLSKYPLSVKKTGEVLLALNYMLVANMNTEIEKWLTLLIEKNPDSDLYPRKLARFYVREKSFQKALPWALKAVRLSSLSPFWNYVILAQVQKELKLQTEALETVEKALALPEAKEKKNKSYVEQLNKIKI
jgi:thiol-disulfide isomerase/thioredoxin